MSHIVILVGVAAVRQALAALSIATASLGTAFFLHRGSVPSRLENARNTIRKIKSCLKDLSDEDKRKIKLRSRLFFDKLDNILIRLQETINTLESSSVTAAFTQRFLWSKLMAETKQAENDLNKLYLDLAKTTSAVRPPTGYLLGTTARAMSEWQRTVREFQISAAKAAECNNHDERRSNQGLTPPTSETGNSDHIRTVLTRRTMSLDDDDSESFQIGSEVQVD